MSATPIRIQRSRKAGARMQEQAANGLPVVSIARPGKWGNPFRVVLEGVGYRVKGPGFESVNSFDKANKFMATYLAVGNFRQWIKDTPEGKDYLEAARVELKGKNLACFCSLDSVCHGDVLLKLVNE